MKDMTPFLKSSKICEKFSKDSFYRYEGYILKENKLCVSNCSTRNLLVCEAHKGGLMGAFWGPKDLRYIERAFLLA